MFTFPALHPSSGSRLQYLIRINVRPPTGTGRAAGDGPRRQASVSGHRKAAERPPQRAASAGAGPAIASSRPADAIRRATASRSASARLSSRSGSTNQLVHGFKLSHLAQVTITASSSPRQATGRGSAAAVAQTACRLRTDRSAMTPKRKKR